MKNSSISYFACLCLLIAISSCATDDSSDLQTPQEESNEDNGADNGNDSDESDGDTNEDSNNENDSQTNRLLSFYYEDGSKSNEVVYPNSTEIKPSYRIRSIPGKQTQLLYDFDYERLNEFRTSPTSPFPSFDLDFEFFSASDEIKRIYFQSFRTEPEPETKDEIYELNYNEELFIDVDHQGYPEARARIYYNDSGVPYRTELFSFIESTFIVASEIIYDSNKNPIRICYREDYDIRNPLECHTLTYDDKKNPSFFLMGESPLPYSHHQLLATMRLPQITTMFPGDYDNSINFISTNNPITITDPEMNVITFNYEYNDDGFPVRIYAPQINPSALILEYEE